MKRLVTCGLACAIAITLLAALKPPVSAQEAAEEVTQQTENLLPTAITLRVTNRLYPEYLEYITTEVGDTNQIGDTDYFFSITEFYPHFAMIDSTKQIVSLSEELKNPAFRITVFENEEVADQTWAFYLIRVPHFARTSYTAFEVMEFDYRGEHHTRKIEGSTSES